MASNLWIDRVASLMNSLPKLVFSRTLRKLDWAPATLIRDDIPAEIAKLKARPGKDLALFAGAGIASTFMNLDLIDEYRLMVHPIVLAGGIPLFKDTKAERKLKLLEAKAFTSGVVLVRYERDRTE